MPQDITRVLVIRHGETAWNRESRIQGHIDIPLNDQGRWQAERLAQALADEPLAAIYSSDLQRAFDTAQAIAEATGLDVVADETLRERHFGDMEGLTHDEILARWPVEGRRWRERDPSFGPLAVKPCSCSTSAVWRPPPDWRRPIRGRPLPWSPMAVCWIAFTGPPMGWR